MTSLGFFRSAVVALIISIAAVVLFYCTTILFSNGEAIRLTISAATFGYICYLLSSAEVSFGKLTIVATYLAGTAAMLLVWPDIVLFALFHVGFIWLVRTVYYHNNIFCALADLAFSTVSFIAAVGAVLQSNSVFLSFWSFFLAQALVMPVLHYLFRKRESDDHKLPAEQGFYEAHRNAENALRKLAGQP